jgi:hypothetical protein
MLIMQSALYAHIHGAGLCSLVLFLQMSLIPFSADQNLGRENRDRAATNFFLISRKRGNATLIPQIYLAGLLRLPRLPVSARRTNTGKLAGSLANLPRTGGQSTAVSHSTPQHPTRMKRPDRRVDGFITACFRKVVFTVSCACCFRFSQMKSESSTGYWRSRSARLFFRSAGSVGSVRS